MQLKFVLSRKKLYNWTVLLRLVFLDKEHSSEVFQTLFAVPHFSKVSGKMLKANKFAKIRFYHRCFFCELFENFQNIFYRTPQDGCFYLFEITWCNGGLGLLFC